MKRVYLMIVVAISFTACGGSSSNTNESIVLGVIAEDNNNSYSEKIEIDVECAIPESIDSYIELQKGDKIIKEETNSTIGVYHDENSMKRVCLDSGVAYIERVES